jgi:hypothetical protein
LSNRAHFLTFLFFRRFHLLSFAGRGSLFLISLDKSFKDFDSRFFHKAGVIHALLSTFLSIPSKNGLDFKANNS